MGSLSGPLDCALLGPAEQLFTMAYGEYLFYKLNSAYRSAGGILVESFVRVDTNNNNNNGGGCVLFNHALDLFVH